jgi:hypothetical protein
MLDAKGAPATPNLKDVCCVMRCDYTLVRKQYINGLKGLAPQSGAIHQRIASIVTKSRFHYAVNVSSVVDNVQFMHATYKMPSGPAHAVYHTVMQCRAVRHHKCTSCAVHNRGSRGRHRDVALPPKPKTQHAPGKERVVQQGCEHRTACCK